MSNVQESLLQAAIPGQSLTDEPKNFPWERSPEYSDPTEAARFELKKLNRPEVLDSVLALLQTGFPIIPLAETIKTNSQAEGLYNPDIGLLIAPVIIQQLVSTAEDAGLDYVMGDEVDEEEMSDKEDERIDAMLKKKVTKMLSEDPSDELISDALDFLSEEERDEDSGMENTDNVMPDVEEVIEKEEDKEVIEAPKSLGLMSRGSM